MSINYHAGAQAEGVAEDNVRSLAGHARQFQQFVHGLRNFISIAAQSGLSAVP